jgi:hypothetical protein
LRQLQLPGAATTPLPVSGGDDESVSSVDAPIAGPTPWAMPRTRRGASRRWIIAAVEGSLQRLQTDYIDLYQYHRPDTETDIEETLSALTDLMRCGKIRAIGTSKLPAADIVEAQWVAERRGLQRFRCEQPNYSILNRGIERDVLPVTERYGMGTIVWSPLAQGLLTGRVRKGQQSELTRSGPYYAHLRDETRIDVVEQFILLADEAGLSLTHLAMAFVIAHPGVTAALLDPRTIDQTPRPARRCRRSAGRRHPRPHRRDRPARRRHRSAPDGLQPARRHDADPAATPDPRTKRRVNEPSRKWTGLRTLSRPLAGDSGNRHRCR